ncbi:antibiotic biosynthesis monooxygenase [Actinomadura vinacea]|uniref:Antibiotic biosynthesis monooxygenase n=1 Tax=Actinomadura vinacea TaxID=115336 RepID=A0ABN3IR77_9ACTN
MTRPEQAGAAFRVMLRMQIVPGKEQDFERVWYSIGDAVNSNPANLGQWLLRDTVEDGVYYIMSDWVDETRFREFERSAGHVEHRKKLHPYRLHGSMVAMNVVYDLGRRPVPEPGR